MKYMEYINDPALEKMLLADKLPAPLITLLAQDKPEIQYVGDRFFIGNCLFMFFEILRIDK